MRLAYYFDWLMIDWLIDLEAGNIMADVVNRCAEDIELQPLNGQSQTVDAAAMTTPAPNWEAHDAVDVVVLDGKKKRDM